MILLSCRFGFVLFSTCRKEVPARQVLITGVKSIQVQFSLFVLYSQQSEYMKSGTCIKVMEVLHWLLFFHKGAKSLANC